MNFQVGIVTFDRFDLLKECLKSLDTALEGHEKSFDSVMVYINENDSETEAWLRSSQDFSYSIQILSSSQPTTPSMARNALLEKAHSDYLLFLDDDVVLPKDYFLKALSILKSHENIAVLGGPDTQPTPPINNTQKIFSMALESWDVTGPTLARHRMTEESELKKGSEVNLILCHLWFETRLFKEEGFQFDSEFFRSEENNLLMELESAGEKIVYSPTLNVFHQRKKSLFKILKTYWISGRYRFLCIQKRGVKKNAIYLAPLILMVGGSVIYGWRGLLFLSLMYLSINACSTLFKVSQSRGSYQQKFMDIFALFFMKFIILVPYFFGLSFQMLNILRWKKREN